MNSILTYIFDILLFQLPTPDFGRPDHLQSSHASVSCFPS